MTFRCATIPFFFFFFFFPYSISGAIDGAIAAKHDIRFRKTIGKLPFQIWIFLDILFEMEIKYRRRDFTRRANYISIRIISESTIGCLILASIFLNNKNAKKGFQRIDSILFPTVFNLLLEMF